jgi:hypothetical protein
MNLLSLLKPIWLQLISDIVSSGMYPTQSMLNLWMIELSLLRFLFSVFYSYYSSLCNSHTVTNTTWTMAWPKTLWLLEFIKGSTVGQTNTINNMVGPYYILLYS